MSVNPSLPKTPATQSEAEPNNPELWLGCWLRPLLTLVLIGVSTLATKSLMGQAWMDEHEPWIGAGILFLSIGLGTYLAQWMLQMKGKK